MGKKIIYLTESDIVRIVKRSIRESQNIQEKESVIQGKFKGDLEMGNDYHRSRPLGNWQSDNAWDLFAPAGTVWKSLTKGKVSKVHDTGRNSGKIYGTQVTVKGEDGYPDIFYTHLKNVDLKPGDKINVGDYVGEISEWGTSKSTHVHVGLPEGKELKDLLKGGVSMGSGSDSTFVDDFIDKYGMDFFKKPVKDKDIKDDDDGFNISGYNLTDLVDKVKTKLGDIF
jgi:murein DD-endopeptidase MepM/ murein hydrolase activator NlpD